MAEQNTTTTTTSDGALPTTTTATTSSAQQRSSQSRSQSNITTPPSSEQSIEEEIEEAFESSEAHEDINEEEELQLSEAVGYTKPKVNSKPLHEVFGLLDDIGYEAGAEALAKSAQSAKDLGGTSKHVQSLRTQDVGQFEIDDEQLTGSNIAQHFVLEDEDEDNDDDDDLDDIDISLPLEKRMVHSRHELSETEQVKSNVEYANSEQLEESKVEPDENEVSLSNQSTADDVSDLIDEPQQLSSLVEEQAEATPNETSLSQTLQNSLTKVETQSESVAKTKTPQSEKSIEPSVMPLQGGSPVHSEQDHSLEELVATNASIEITLETINQSMDETLADEQSQMITDLDVEVIKVAKIHNVQQLDDVPQMEAKVTEPKMATATETLHLKAQQLEPLVLASIKELDSTILPKLSSTILNINDGHETLAQQMYDTLNAIELNADDEEEEDTSLQMMKLRILAMKHQIPTTAAQLSPTECCVANVSTNEIKQMERIPLTEYSKDVLEDITEESERCNSLSTAEDQQQSLSLESKTILQPTAPMLVVATEESTSSVVSLNMLQMLEQKVAELQSMLVSKDACLASLNLQLENSMRRESINGASLAEQPTSGRDTSSLVTNSTEYRTLQEDFGAPTMDFYMELTKRDELIMKLTDSLQQSLNVRESLQTESEKLNNDVQMLRKQLSEAVDTLRRPFWPRVADQESNAGQRISEISMDLISESDDDLDRQFLTDNEDKFSRNSRERQLSMPRQSALEDIGTELVPDCSGAFSKQIEQFQKYLTPSEARLFFMVQKKFDDYLCQELEKSKLKYEQEFKLTTDQWESEKLLQNEELEKLMNLKQTQATQHSKEMEELRKYFETKCADLEKQFSDDVFSQKSQHHGGDSSSECSEPEQMPDEIAPTTTVARSKETSPRKRTRAELLLSPSHRQMTPFGIESLCDETRDGNGNISLEIADLKAFYQTKIHELNRANDERMRKISERLQYYESRYDDDFILLNKNNNKISTTKCTCNVDNKIIKDEVQIQQQQQQQQQQQEHVDNAMVAAVDSNIAGNLSDDDNQHNTSLIIIDQDELNFNNESQVIQKIIKEYERRLQEQLALARADIVHELEQQIQNLLSETITDDQHWPKELILLREKFTAKSQLEIAQLQIKHADEMSRVKLDYEKQINRKNQRHSTFDAARDLNQIITERDGLRELSKTFQNVLTRLAKCVVNCEEDLNATLADEVQRLISNNRTCDEQELEQTFSIFNTSLNASKHLRLAPDVQSLLEVIEDPSLIQFINNEQNGDDANDDFDLNDCLERLKSEAGYLLQLSEELQKQHQPKQRLSVSSVEEKRDDCSEVAAELKLTQQKHKFLRTNSLNEQQLNRYCIDAVDAATSKTQQNTSLPPDLSRIRLHNATDAYSSPDGNASELNFQMVELKNRLIKSESDRHNLQKQLEHTINLNAELGEELQSLRDQLSQLSSLNHIDYAEGYGLASLKSPQRLTGLDKSSASFAQLQEKARNLLSTPTSKQRENNDATVILLQMIEDFCREGDKVVECSKKDREDLQSQIDTADKQLKATRQFLEEQATEREQERDEFLREIERLKVQLKDKEKEHNSYANASEEYAHLDSQLRDAMQKLNESNGKRDKFEVELKASIDKIFVLREIISDLEMQVETKALNEHVLGEQVKQLEDYINAQTRSNEMLQNEVQCLKTEIGESYQSRILMLEEKLQNVRPSAEQSMILDQVVEQLRDIEHTLDQKTKTLELLHSATSSNSCSLSATEDVSVHGSRPTTLLPTAIISPPQGSPVHPSPRQHSFTMEGVQRVVEKLGKHTRAEEAAIKRIRDLEMHLAQIRAACVELQHERDSLQERMSEQTQRITTLQARLEDQRQRAEELHRAGTTDLNIRVHDLQSESQSLRETLSARDKQINTMRQQLERSKVAIDRLEAEVTVVQQPDRSLVERLESEVKQKNIEIQKLKDKIKSEMINRLALPDLMETMMADKNEEIDHLREQLEAKEKELQTALDFSQGSSVVGAVGGGVDKHETSHKLSARTLSDIISISEFDEPDVVRRAAANSMNTPMLMPEGSGGFMQQTMNSSKEVVANLTHKRSDDLSGFAQLHAVNTFDNPHYFQDPNVLLGSAQSGDTLTPGLVPRHINFSTFTEDSKLKTPILYQTTEKSPAKDTKQIAEIDALRQKLDTLEKEKALLKSGKAQELQALEEDLTVTRLRLGGLQDQLEERQTEIEILNKELQHYKQLKSELDSKTAAYNDLMSKQEKLNKDCKAHTEQLSKQEKNLLNYVENEQKYLKRIAYLEAKILETTANEANERENLRKELRCLSEAHAQCKYTQRDAEQRKREIDQMNEELKEKDSRLLQLTTKLSLSEERCTELQRRVEFLELELDRLKQQNSDNSSKQFSVDEIAKQVEKELNYSAQLDSNILKAIESEEENNLDTKLLTKETETIVKSADQQGTDDENFTGERDLLNQLEALRAQIAVERDQGDAIRNELFAEKQHSQEIQEQDVLIIEAMRKRLETALEKEDELHKQIDIERERCERLQTQLTALQRAESRRNSSLLLKSPTESPRKSPRSLTDFESELGERLRGEIKLLVAQNERERERSADIQRSSERERQRYEKELQERIDYCERLKREMERQARDKDNAEHELDHLQERLTLQTAEIESLEARLVTLQEAETRRSTRRDRQHQESAQLLAELQELKTKLIAGESERDELQKKIGQLRFDIERSAQRESKLADALSRANDKLSQQNSAEDSVPQQFLQKMKEIDAQLAENTQMAETVQILFGERRALQKKCEELETQLSNSANSAELEERCRYLLGRYLRVESHRKALVYQKRYLKMSLSSYQESEQRAIAALHGTYNPPRDKRKLFKTVALAIIAIQRFKFIARNWHTGKRIVSKSVFTITQQKYIPTTTLTNGAVNNTVAAPPSNGAMRILPSASNVMNKDLTVPQLQTPSSSTMDWITSMRPHKQQ